MPDKLKHAGFSVWLPLENEFGGGLGVIESAYFVARACACQDPFLFSFHIGHFFKLLTTEPPPLFLTSTLILLGKSLYKDNFMICIQQCVL